MINLSSLEIKNKNLVIRVDMNVPISDGKVLDTCWNGGVVDYIGGRRGAQPVAFTVLNPTHNGSVLSDHRWMAGVYRYPVETVSPLLGSTL